MAQEAFEDIVETFEFLEDWEDRYRHVIDMGKAMPALEEAFRVPATKVDGCASQVWLVPAIEGTGETATFNFRGESDAMIVRWVGRGRCVEGGRRRRACAPWIE